MTHNRMMALGECVCARSAAICRFVVVSQPVDLQRQCRD